MEKFKVDTQEEMFEELSPEARKNAEAMVAALKKGWAENGVGQLVEARNAQASAKQLSRPSRASTAHRPSRLIKERESYRLPFWPEHRRGVSNDMARSALFTVRRSEKREQFKGRPIHALKNVEMLYTGEELRQRDQDVLLQLLHFGRLSNLGEPIPFVAHDMLKQLGWSINSRSYKELAESIERMQASSLHIQATHLDKGYGCSLIQSFAYQGRAGDLGTRWSVTLEPRLAQLYTHVAYTLIDWEQRLKLKPMSKWLHTFYSTHQNPYAMKVSTLLQLCGTATKELWRFRIALKESLQELVEVGFLKAWSIDPSSDLVEVLRSHEPSALPSPKPLSEVG